ncbi:hypothetical protein AM593_09395, partial [Mytilus galloprovincialis]
KGKIFLVGGPLETQQCVKKKCESKNGRYKSCKINSVPEDNSITSVTIENEKGSGESNEGCIFNVTFSLYCFARNVRYENKNDEQNNTGNQNDAYINSNASDTQGNNKNYTTLGNERDNHYYKDTRNSPQRESEYYNIEPRQSQIEYHTNEPHSYMTVYDTLDQNRQSALTNATYEEFQQKENGSTKILGKTGDKHYDYAEFASSITNSQDSTNSKISNEPHEYFILDPKEITYENHKYHSSGKKSYSSQTKDYFVLDPKETGFDRSSIKNLDTF